MILLRKTIILEAILSIVRTIERSKNFEGATFTCRVNGRVLAKKAEIRSNNFTYETYGWK